MKKYLSLFLCLIAVIALVITGCGGTHGYGSDAVNGPLNVKEWEVKDGKVTAELGGFKFSFDESNMKDGIFVTLKQLEATEPSKESELVGSSYIYDLKALLKKSGTLESDVTVKTLEKAANITIQNDIPGANRYLLGMRNEGDNDWSYSLINDDNETNPLFVTSARFSSALASLPEFKIKTYNVNRQFRLFAYKGTEEIKKTIVASAKLASKEQEIKTVRGSIFNEDLPVEIKLAGVNSDSLTADDFEVKVHYQSDTITSQNIYIDGSAAKNEHSDNGVGSGDKYANTISFKPLQTNFSNSAGIISIKFLINLKDLNSAEFAENFTVEVTNASDKALPFSYADSCKLTLKTVSGDIRYIEAGLLQPENGSETVPVDQKDVVIEFDEEINWTTDCEALVKVTSTNANETGAQYVYKYSPAECLLFVARQSNFAPDAEYKVEISEGIMGTAENTMVKPVTFSFTTAAQSEPSKTDITVSSTFAGRMDVEIKTSVEITFDNAIKWDNNCKQYVTMTKDGDTAAIAYGAAYDSNKNVLTITPETNLAYETKYNVLVSKNMPVPENYQIKEDYTFSFTTVAPNITDITVSSTFAGKIDAEIKPSVEIAFDNTINWADECKQYVTMTKDGDTAAIAYGAAYDSNKNVLTITPETNLVFGTKYNVLISKNMPVPENYQIKEDFTFSFTTVANNVTSQITSNSFTGEGSSALYYPKAVFAVKFSYGVETVDADIKAAIKLDGNALGSNDTVVYDKSAKVATITFETPFAGNSEHTISFEGMTAGDGSIIENATALSFKIMPNITVSLTTPATATGVATNTSIVAELSAAVGESAYSADNITIKDSDDNAVTLNSNKTVSGAVYTVTPASSLKWLATYTVTVATATIETTGQKIEGKEFTFCTEPNPDFAGGNGTENNPYLVATAEQLNNVRKYNSGYYFKQIAHINLSSVDWTPISYFSGCSYNGDGYKIENLKSNNGLIKYSYGVKITNVDLSVNITADSGNIGGLVGEAAGDTVIECCHVSGSITVTANSDCPNAGFIAGWPQDNTIITNCYCDNGTITGTSHESNGNVCRLGGICGFINSNNPIKNCYTNITINSIKKAGNNIVGYLIALYFGSIENCFSTESPIINDSNTGGTNCYSDSNGYAVDTGKLGSAWDPEIWNIPTTTPCLPTLKCMKSE